MENKLRRFKLIDKEGYIYNHPRNFEILNIIGSDIFEGCLDEAGDVINDEGAAIILRSEFKYFEEIPLEETPCPPDLTDEHSIQGQLSSIGNLLHNLSCLMENEEHQDILGGMSGKLWEMSILYRQTPEQKLRSKVWDVVAETDISESHIDSITTDILEKFNLEEK